MFGDDSGDDSFEEMLRSFAREVVNHSMDRAAQVDLDEIAGAIGVDPVRAREFVEGAVDWLRDQVDDLPLWSARTGAETAHRDRRLHRGGPHPMDLPTAAQGTALAALDSGRWTVEPGSHALVAHGEGPAPSDMLGLVGELRARDWIAANGEVTQSGRSALSRWLDAAGSQ
ncbi:MAG: hypothetical protein ACLP8S_18400 [Solirubrobacteraceae bacterium]